MCEWLKTEIVKPEGLSVTALAQHLEVSRQTLSALRNGSAGLSAEMAMQFEKAFGTKADTLLRMRAAVELAQARAAEGNIKVGKFAAAVERNRRQGLLPRIA